MSRLLAFQQFPDFPGEVGQFVGLFDQRKIAVQILANGKGLFRVARSEQHPKLRVSTPGLTHSKSLVCQEQGSFQKS